MTVQELLGKKIGTTQVFLPTGEAVCVTAVTMGPCTVTQVKTVESDGYESVQLGYEEARHLSKPREGHLRQAGKLFRYLRETKADQASDLEVGQEIDVSLFQPGESVDATGFSKGRGFAGGVKRHGFKGGPKTHGQREHPRSAGSIGQASDPSRVFKGMKMAGQYGNKKKTIENLKVVKIDSSNNQIFVRGSVPGSNNGILVVNK